MQGSYLRIISDASLLITPSLYLCRSVLLTNVSTHVVLVNLLCVMGTMDVCVCFVTKSCLTLCDPMDCCPAGSSVHGSFPGKNTVGEGLPLPSLGDLPNPGTELVSPASPALASGFFTSEPPEKPGDNGYLRSNLGKTAPEARKVQKLNKISSLSFSASPLAVKHSGMGCRGPLKTTEQFLRSCLCVWD